MSTPADWVEGYARQAAADFRAWDSLQEDSRFPVCHWLMFLQMACEKLCKAHLIRTGSDPRVVQTSHAYVTGPLPELLRSEIARQRRKPKQAKWVLEHARHLA